MRKLRLLLPILLLLSSRAEAQEKWYHSAKYGFTLPTSGWTVIDDAAALSQKMPSEVLALNDRVEGYPIQVVVNVAAVPEELTLAAQTDQVREQVKGYGGTIISEAATTMGGFPAHEMVWKVQANQQTVVAAQRFTIHEGKVYNLALASLQSLYPKQALRFQRLVEGFQLDHH
jgi:hypothetical protein